MFPRQLYGDRRVKAKASTDVVGSSSDSSSSSSSSSDAPDDEEDGKLKSRGEQRYADRHIFLSMIFFYTDDFPAQDYMQVPWDPIFSWWTENFGTLPSFPSSAL